MGRRTDFGAPSPAGLGSRGKPSGEGAQRSSVWSFPRGRSAPRPAPFRGCGEDPARLRWVDRRSTCRCDGCMTLTPDHSSCGCSSVSRVLQLGEGGPALPCLGLWAPEPPWVRVTLGVRGSCPQAAHITPQVISTPRKTRVFPGAAGSGGRRRPAVFLLRTAGPSPEELGGGSRPRLPRSTCVQAAKNRGWRPQREQRACGRCCPPAGRQPRSLELGPRGSALGSRRGSAPVAVLDSGPLCPESRRPPALTGEEGTPVKVREAVASKSVALCSRGTARPRSPWAEGEAVWASGLTRRFLRGGVRESALLCGCGSSFLARVPSPPSGPRHPPGHSSSHPRGTQGQGCAFVGRHAADSLRIRNVCSAPGPTSLGSN